MPSLENAMQGFNIRVTLAERTLTPVEPKRVGARFNGGDEAPGPLAETMRRSKRRENLIPRYATVPKGTSWMTEPATNHVFTRSDVLGSRISADALSGDAYAAVEWDNFKKLTFQQGGNPGWYVMPDGYVMDPDVPVDDELLDEILNAPSSSSPYHPGPVRRQTNHGGPTWSTSDMDMVAHALFAHGCGTWALYESEYAKIAGELTGPRMPCATTLSRTGPISKPVAIYDEDATGTYYLGDAQGYACRRRAVLGEPLTTYFLMDALYRALMAWLLSTRAATSTLSINEIERRVSAAIAAGAYVMNDDMTGYDQSVPARLQDRIHAAFRRFFRGAESATDAWLQTERGPVVCPGLNPGQLFTLLPSKGMIHSGNRNTNTMGTFINIYRAAWCALRMGLRSTKREAAEWATMSGEFLATGDDTLLLLGPASLKKFDKEKWAAASAELNLKCKVSDGAVFLRRWFTEGGSRPLAARVLQQTAFNEHAPRGPALELLAASVRSEGMQGGPYDTEVWDILRTAPESPVKQFRTPEELRDYVATPVMVHRITVEASKKENLPFFSRMGAGAHPGGSTARLLNTINALLGREGADAWTNDNVLALDRKEALEMGKKTFRAVAGGEKTPAQVMDLWENGLRYAKPGIVA